MHNFTASLMEIKSASNEHSQMIDEQCLTYRGISTTESKCRVVRYLAARSIFPRLYIQGVAIKMWSPWNF